MEDYKEDLADYFGRTVVHPVGLTVCLLLAAAILIVPRRWAILPMVLLACFVSAAQRIMVAGTNWDFGRILILAGWLRVVFRGEFRGMRWNALDTCVVAFAVLGVASYTSLHATGDALKYRLGWAYDVVGYYFLFRALLHADADPRQVVKCFVLASVPVAVCFALEFTTGRNWFSVLGGVPEMTWVRDGRLRCQGPFAHPIIAGVFWASILPLVVSTWFSGGRWRWWSAVGTATIVLIVATTNSSTSLMALVFGFAGLAAFPFRRWMPAVRWGAAALVVFLHLLMKAPVWHLLARLTVLDASTGWHRFFVIDQSIRHLDEWWLLGTKTTVHWDVTDITNEYVFVGIEGGAFTLLSMLAILVVAFRRIGALVAAVDARPAACRLAWALGVGLFVHCINFVAVAYFGQARLVWYLGLALVASQPSLVVEAGRAALRETKGARAPVRRRAWTVAR